MSAPNSPIFEFGDGCEFRLNPVERLLSRSGQPIALTPKAFDLLVCLVQNQGHLLSKEELMQAVWPDAFVEEINLTQNVSVLRKALGDTGGGGKFVETVPKRGYRFTAPVRKLDDYHSASYPLAAKPASEIPAEQPSFAHRRRLSLITVATGAAAAVFIALFFYPQWKARSLARNPVLPESMVVLPLVNLSGDASQEYFADGLTDELTTELAKLGPIRVISRTSAMRYKNTHKSLPEIARELHVDAIVEGSLVRADNRVKLTAQLIDVASDGHLWADTYERDRKDAFALPQSMAQDIRIRLEGQLSPEEKARLAQNRQVDPEVYEAYFKGRYFFNKRTAADFKKALAFFQDAIQKDPAYAPAYAGAAQTYLGLASYSAMTAREACPLAKLLATRAVELDGKLAAARVPLAMIQAEFEWNLPAAEKEYREAIALNPSDSSAHQFYAEDVLYPEGRTEESVREMAEAQRLDPSLLMTRASASYGFYLARDYDRALKQAQSTLELDPSFPKTHQMLGLALEGKGMYSQAIEQFETAYRLDQNPGYLAALAREYALNGHPKEARDRLAKLTAISQTHYVHPYSVAVIYLALGEKEKTLQWLERARDERCWFLIYLKVDPRLDSLRSEPRFRALLQQVHYVS